MKVFSWVLVMVGALIGSLFLMSGLLFSSGAPQEAAAAAMACAFVVIPYCFARAISEIGRK